MPSLSAELFEYVIVASPVLLQVFAWLRRGTTLPARVLSLIASSALGITSLLLLIRVATLPCPAEQPPCPPGANRHVLMPGIRVRYEHCGACFAEPLAPEASSALSLNHSRAGWSVAAALASLSINLLLLVGFVRWTRALRPLDTARPTA